MKNPAFSYHRPESVDEAVALLAELGDDAKVLAGGQSLLPTMALRLGPPAHLVDIGRLRELSDVTEHSNGATGIGALVRHAEAEASPVVARRLPLVHEALPYIGHRAIRTRGTVVGSIAHADPAGEMPAVALSSGATIVAVSSDGTREIPAAAFFQGYLQTALRPDELIIEVRFPRWPDGAIASITEVSRRHGDYALVGLAAKVVTDDESVTEAALAFFGVGSVPVRVAEAEAALVGRRLEHDVIADTAAIVSSALEPAPDVHGSAEYRRHLARVLTRRALAAAAAQPGAMA